MKKLLKTPLAWSILANLVLVIMLVARKPCQKLDTTELNNKIIEQQFIIKDYEKKLLIKNAIIDSYSNEQLDSVWATIHSRNH